ncbi:hypothetical protein [Amycolatopsis sp. lyj-112]|uniref:hypothetical protein n=1 Tax=Amycolatopsis sp. lyj-112 TaxID=2789288 RepID=UPI0039785A31
MTSWSLAPDKTERLLRCAQFQIWSANEGSESELGPTLGGPGSVDEVRKIIEAAGFEVRGFGRYNDLGVVLDGQVKTFYTASAISKSLGDPGRRLYRWWSGIAHHVSWAVSSWKTLRLHDDTAGADLSISRFRGETPWSSPPTWPLSSSPLGSRWAPSTAGICTDSKPPASRWKAKCARRFRSSVSFSAGLMTLTRHNADPGHPDAG